jgi:hypothetical protein
LRVQNIKLDFHIE